MRFKLLIYSVVAVMLVIYSSSCNNKGGKNAKTAVFKGLYSFGPEVKSFKDCDNTGEYWVADSSLKLELAYSKMNFEKPYEPVYIEVEGKKIPSGTEGKGSEFDSTLVVTKLVKITREIPEEMCR
jgi:copper homeostasis protein (lipoprotein)